MGKKRGKKNQRTPAQHCPCFPYTFYSLPRRGQGRVKAEKEKGGGWWGKKRGKKGGTLESPVSPSPSIRGFWVGVVRKKKKKAVREKEKGERPGGFFPPLSCGNQGRRKKKEKDREKGGGRGGGNPVAPRPPESHPTRGKGSGRKGKKNVSGPFFLLFILWSAP